MKIQIFGFGPESGSESLSVSAFTQHATADPDSNPDSDAEWFRYHSIFGTA
jgi:hypothetical protein